MKKTLSLILAVMLTIALTNSACAATKQELDEMRDVILNTFPDYVFEDNMIKPKGQPSDNAAMVEGEGTVAIVLSSIQAGSSSYTAYVVTFIWIDNTYDTLTINTGTKLYELKIKDEPPKDGAGMAILPVPVGSLGQMMNDIIGAEKVTITLKYGSKETSFELNESQKKLLELSNKYYLALRDEDLKKNGTGLQAILESILESGIGFTVDIKYQK